MFGFAPALSSKSTVSGSSFSTAQWRAVEPSVRAALTSAFCWSKWRRASWSCCLTASATCVKPDPASAAKPAAAQQMTSAVIRIHIHKLNQIPVLDFEIAIDQRARESGGADIDRQHTAVAQPAKQPLAALDHLKRGGMPVHLLHVPRDGAGEFRQIRLPDGGKDNKMAPGQVYRIFDYLGCGRSLGEIRQPNRQASAALAVQQGAHGPGVIRFRGLAVHL